MKKVVVYSVFALMMVAVISVVIWVLLIFNSKLNIVNATVTQVSGNKITIKTDVKISNNDIFEIENNNFEENDRIELKYVMSKNGIKVKELKKLPEEVDDNPNWMNVEFIVKNEKLKSFSKSIDIMVENNPGNFKIAFPVKLDNKVIKTFSIQEFLRELDHFDFEAINTEKGKKLFINYDEKNYQLLNIVNLSNLENKIDYEKTDQGVKFSSLGTGYYIAEFKLVNNDIIKLIFT